MKKYLYILIILSIASCKKQTYPESTSEVPVFKMAGTLNGAPFSFAAGQQGVYMSSDAIQNDFGVYELNCRFLETDCAGCAPIMDFLITNNQAQQQGEACDPDALEIGEIPLATQTNSSDFLEIHFHAPDQPGNNYEWDFGDSQTGSGDNPHHEYDEPGLYVVTLQSENGSGSDDDVIIRQQILAGTPEYISMPFNILNLPEEEWEFVYGILPPNLEVVSWTVNGNDYYGNNLHFEGEDEINVCLNFINTSLNQTGFYCVEFHGENNGQVNDFFSYQWEAQVMNFGKAECRYRNASGEIYTSVTELNQSPDSFIQIQSVEDYEDGLDGSNAKKVLASFNLWMINTTNPDDIIHFENVTTTLGFAVE